MTHDWLEDPLMFVKEGSLLYRKPRNLKNDAAREWKSFHFSTRLKLEAADHFCRLALGAASMPDDMGLPLLAFRQTKWYLDAFFFELMSAYDTLLQEMNVVYSINVDIEKVAWSSIINKNEVPTTVIDLMEKERDAEWFRKVRWYRNTATHRMYVPTAWEKGGMGELPWDYDHHEVALVYFDAETRQRTEESISVCADYLKNMVQHVHAVWVEVAKEFHPPGL